MERDLGCSRLPYLSGCVPASPAACFPVHEGSVGYTRIHGGAGGKRSAWRWRYLLRKWVKDSMSIYGSKSLSFQYDAVSYSQNFDEGSRCYESYNRENEIGISR
ncbi:hypothetical protein E5676_scaffold3040G00010 [Cucumis melo var. makuwa]|uniref:Uncharacterized protein n=2 Tax=Cucumis melo TaxID=3656 RepID=A0A5D3BBB9_CUCMM|nr:hypothetical protein E6C27_scaffold25649G00010 [Cucumis melo var. makuwa]TYJ97130.1 hypothetical protein E5676_scaffold3040G00010 [Cucumis melo var. makuwa]